MLGVRGRSLAVRWGLKGVQSKAGVLCVFVDLTSNDGFGKSLAPGLNASSFGRLS